MQTLRMRPPAYHFLSWHEFGNTQFSCHVEQLLAKLTDLAGGSLPDRLDSEQLLRTFCGDCGIRVAEEDIEPVLIFPHRLYANREWVQGEYKKFVGFCRASGWLDGGAETPDPPQVKRGRGRPRINPLPS